MFFPFFAIFALFFFPFSFIFYSLLLDTSKIYSILLLRHAIPCLATLRLKHISNFNSFIFYIKIITFYVEVFYF